MLANYEIYCDENWLTHRVQIGRTIGNDVKSLSLSVESRGVWRRAGQELRETRDCDDVDLAIGDVPCGALLKADVFGQVLFLRGVEDLFDLFDTHLQLHEAGVDLDAAVAEQTTNAGGLSDAFETHANTLGDFGLRFFAWNRWALLFDARFDTLQELALGIRDLS